MDFALLVTSMAAVLGWFLAVWKWIDASAWQEQAERSERELLRVQHQLGNARDELARWSNHCGCGRESAFTVGGDLHTQKD
jgi:cytoskeletal protein RodZ